MMQEGSWTEDWWRDVEESIRADQEGITREFAPMIAKEPKTDYGRVLQLEHDLKVEQFARQLESCMPFDITGEDVHA